MATRRLYEDRASDRLDAALKALRRVDTPIVWKLDRPGRDLRIAERGSSARRRSRYCGASLYLGVIRLAGINLEQPGGPIGNTGGIDVFAAGKR